MNTVVHFFRSLDLEQSLVLLFVVMLGTEWILSKINRIHIHQLHDSINNMLIGGISFLFDFLFTMLMLPVWYYIYHHWALFHFATQGWIILLLLFVLVDFSEYWFHRLSHEINVLWQAHVVHHQSEFFNLTVGVRTSLFVPLFNFFIYSLFPLAGFNPETTLLIIFIQGIYQLLIHTELVGKLGILEKLIVTPSAHRVHHGKNEIYIDKNYGKFLIVWDRLFGTYQAETEEVSYGITTPLKKKGAFHSIFEPFRQLAIMCAQVKDRKKRRMMLFGSPDEVVELIKQESIPVISKRKKRFYTR
jgi:alkylglycerol monooxygenase